jgi:16S rRNA (adenine1518-N6/adenine1519-N6)-dimethyltransferase
MSFILKKRYGQNFLIDQNILNKISNLINSENLNILEIGPGNGKLTDGIILKKPSLLTLIEIDIDLIKYLSQKYSLYKKINLINADILDYEIKDYYQLIISNLPYNISSQILVKLSTMRKQPDTLILMFQKEFAQRLLDKKLNSINSLIRCFYNIKLNFNVSKNCYRPIPKVDSSVLTFNKLKKKIININEINKFIIFKRNLFSHKRKSLKKLLKKYNLKNEFDLNLRVEDLNLDELVKIFRATSS